MSYESSPQYNRRAFLGTFLGAGAIILSGCGSLEQKPKRDKTYAEPTDDQTADLLSLFQYIKGKFRKAVILGYKKEFLSPQEWLKEGDYDFGHGGNTRLWSPNNSLAYFQIQDSEDLIVKGIRKYDGNCCHGFDIKGLVPGANGKDQIGEFDDLRKYTTLFNKQFEEDPNIRNSDLVYVKSILDTSIIGWEKYQSWLLKLDLYGNFYFGAAFIIPYTS